VEGNTKTDTVASKDYVERVDENISKNAINVQFYPEVKSVIAGCVLSRWEGSEAKKKPMLHEKI
jgi:hypothetical protein